MKILSIILRLILIILFASDIVMNRRFKKKDPTLKRYLTKSQEVLKYMYFFVVAAGIFVPFDNIFILLTLFALVYFFIYTDKEVYANMHAVYLRGKYFEFKKMKNFSYQNRVLQFDYNNEHIKMSKPLLDEGFIQREIVHKAQKAEAKQIAKEKRNKR